MSKSRITQINFVTRDLEKVKKTWNIILGKIPDAEYHLGDFGKQRDIFQNQEINCSDVKAIKYVVGDKNIEDLFTGKRKPEEYFFLAFWEPGENDTPWKKYLEEHGEGIMDIELEVQDRRALYEQLGKEPYHVGYFPDSTYSFLNIKESALTDLNIVQKENNKKYFKEMV